MVQSSRAACDGVRRQSPRIPVPSMIRVPGSGVTPWTFMAKSDTQGAARSKEVLIGQAVARECRSPAPLRREAEIRNHGQPVCRKGQQLIPVRYVVHVVGAHPIREIAVTPCSRSKRH